jgi:hypothetical protein
MSHKQKLILLKKRRQEVRQWAWCDQQHQKINSQNERKNLHRRPAKQGIILGLSSAAHMCSLRLVWQWVVTIIIPSSSTIDVFSAHTSPQGPK